MGIVGNNRREEGIWLYNIFYRTFLIHYVYRNTQLILQEETAIKQVRKTKEAVAMKMQ